MILRRSESAVMHRPPLARVQAQFTRRLGASSLCPDSDRRVGGRCEERFRYNA